MANSNGTPMANGQTNPLVRATVILRIPDLDTGEVTALYQEIQKILDKFGGEFDVNMSPQPPSTNQ